MALTEAEQDVVDIVRVMLGFFDKIAVFDEVLVPINNLRTIFKTQYKNWDPDEAPIVYLNDGRGSPQSPSANPIMQDGVDYSYDSDTGQVALSITPFPDGLKVGDTITGTYQFRYFTDDEFELLIDKQMHIINARKPITMYTTVAGLPLELNASLILGLYINCLERLWLDQHLWKAALVYMDISAARSMIQQQIQTMRLEYDIVAKKPRSLASPAAISSGKYYTLQRIEGDNFRQFTILGGP